MKKAIVYTRFSPRKDASKSESCETQEAACREWAAKKGVEIERVYHDPDVSGKDEYRSQLWAAVKALERGWVLLVYKRDRLARNLYLSEMINRAVEQVGGRVVAVTGDVEGDTIEVQLIRQILGAIHEYERKMMAGRTRDSMRLLQASGRKMSHHPPYGWRVDPTNDKRLVQDEGEQKAIRWIFKMRAEGMKMREMVKALNKDWALEGRGEHWFRQKVYRILSTRQADYAAHCAKGASASS